VIPLHIVHRIARFRQCENPVDGRTVVATAVGTEPVPQPGSVSPTSRGPTPARSPGRRDAAAR
jgi:hypothetical protein